VNGGSLEPELLKLHGGVTARALTESALRHVRLCEDFGFDRLVVSIKSSDVPLMIETNRLLSKSVDYPLHLGVTESGTIKSGAIRSAVGIGALLAEGIGDTIRVSLTGDPVEEVHAAYAILSSLGLRRKGIRIVSCPTCGRTRTDLVEIAEAVESALDGLDLPITVAVMGCAVNGPGEAAAADLGVACGQGSALFFKNGRVVRKIKEDEIVSTLVEEVRHWND
jgi:(E)-4-hydroxy-3-methylbut-2-enyl-diphosphate synthase